jgi:hypothetical protein
MPEDEIERLRAALARAHERKQPILSRLIQRIFLRATRADTNIIRDMPPDKNSKDAA